jgi:hypothetical protein
MSTTVRTALIIYSVQATAGFAIGFTILLLRFFGVI